MIKLLKQLTLVNTTSSCLHSENSVIKRGYAFKSDLKIKWVRPERILCIRPQKSGDLSAFPNIDKQNYVHEFKDCKELETADENVKRVFRLEFNRGKNTTNFYSNELVSSVQRHELDLGSMEAKLASMTATIRNLQDHMELNPRNKKMLVVCKELIDRRKKFLRHLRRWDYKRFEWILEKLDLVYKAYPAKYHWITRKESLVKLTDIHCENIRNERITVYRNELEAKQLEFLETKLKNMEFIRQEQIDCNVPVTISADDIKAVRAKYEQIKSKNDS